MGAGVQMGRVVAIENRGTICVEAAERQKRVPVAGGRGESGDRWWYWRRGQ